ncbi:MAG: DUF1178 family protein [Betaproteobacteria bacterium]
MIVFNLCCHDGHRFEGWFASSDDFERQRGSGLLQCPVCGKKSIDKLPSAPRLNLTSSGSSPSVENEQVQLPVAEEAAGRAQMLAAQTAFYRHLRQMFERSDDVGERFAEEARRIHYKETPERQIHGVATRAETVELLEEGVAILPLPGLIKRKKDLN